MRKLPVNKTGYLKGSKTVNNPINIIPSNLITTQGMAFPIKANGKTLYPNTGQYKFPTSHVVETPLKQQGVNELDPMEHAKFPYRIKDKKRRDTQIVDIYNATLDHHRGDTTNAKRAFKSFFTHYGSERFDGVRPLEGYYGFDKKDYEDKTLDSLGRDWHKQMKVSKKKGGDKSAKIPHMQKGINFLKLAKKAYNKAEPYINKAKTTIQDFFSNPVPRKKLSSAPVSQAPLPESIVPAPLGSTINLQRKAPKPKSTMFKFNMTVPDPNFKIDKIYRGSKDHAKHIKIHGKSGYMFANRDPETGSYHINAKMEDPLESGKAMLKLNENFEPFPELLENNSYSLDSYKSVLKLGNRNGWKLEDAGYIPLNASAIHNKTLHNLGIPQDIGTALFDTEEKAKVALDEVNNMLKKHKLPHEANISKNEAGEFFINLPNFKASRNYKQGSKNMKSLIKYQEGSKNLIIPESQKKQMAEDERKSYLEFMHHPSYKKRLLKEMYGKEANPKNIKQNKSLEEEYERRVKTISDIPVKFKKIPYYGQTIPGENNAKRILLSPENEMNTNPEQFKDVIRHEFGHAVNNAILGRGGNNKNPVESIMKRESKPGRKAMSELMTEWSSQESSWDKGEKEKVIRQAAKEFGTEEVNKVLKLRKAADDERLDNAFKSVFMGYKPKIDEWPEFNKILDRDTFEALYQNPTEAAARLSNIRRLAAEKFGHDMNEDFDVKKYGPQIEEFYKEKGVKSPLNDVRQQGFSDEAINEMMKYIAKKNTQTTNTPYQAKNGVKLIKYKDGSKGVSLSFSRGEKDPKGGLTQKGVDKYNRATGGNLKMAVTTPPSKLKPGSKAANRRKSFCARMSGVKGPMAKNGKPTRKALALRKWNC